MRGGVRQPTCVVRMTTRRMYSQICALKDVPTIRTAGDTRGASRRRRGDMTEQEQIEQLEEDIRSLRADLQEIKSLESQKQTLEGEDDEFYLLKFQKEDDIKEKLMQIEDIKSKIERSKRRDVEVQFKPAKFFGMIPLPLKQTKKEAVVQFMNLLDLDTKKPNPTDPTETKLKSVGEMRDEIQAYVGTINSPGHLRETFVDMNIYNETKWNEPGFHKLNTREMLGLEPFQQLCVFQTEILQKTTSQSVKQEYKADEIAQKTEKHMVELTKQILGDFYFEHNNVTLDENDPMPFTLEKTNQADLEDWYDTTVPADQRYDARKEQMIRKLNAEIEAFEAELSKLSDEDPRKTGIEASIVKIERNIKRLNKSPKVDFLRNKIKEWLVSNATSYYEKDEIDPDHEQTDDSMSAEEMDERYAARQGGINFERHYIWAFKTNEARIDQAENDIQEYNAKYPDGRISTVAEIRETEDNDTLMPTSENYEPDTLLGIVKEKTDAAMVNALIEDITEHNKKHGSDIPISLEDVIWDTEEDERESQLKVLHGRIDHYNKRSKTPMTERDIVDVNDVVSLDLPDDLDLFQQYNLLTKRMTIQDTHRLTDEARDSEIMRAHMDKSAYESFLSSLSNKYLANAPGDGADGLEGRERAIYEYQKNMHDSKMEKTFEGQFVDRLLTTDSKKDNRFMKELNKLYRRYNASDEDVYNSGDWEEVKASVEAAIKGMRPDKQKELSNRIYFEESNSDESQEEIRKKYKSAKRQLSKLVLQGAGLKFK